MGHLVSKHRPSDPSGGEGQRGLDEEHRDGRAGQGVECCVQGPCPLHPPPVPQNRPLLVSALRGSVPCLHTSHLLPRPIFPGSGGYLGRIRSQTQFLGNGSPPNFTNIGSHHNSPIIAQTTKPLISSAIVKLTTF